MDNKNSIKAGAKVKYTTYVSADIKEGKVIAIFTIKDHINKNYIGAMMGYVEYKRECQPDLVFVNDMSIVES